MCTSSSSHLLLCLCLLLTFAAHEVSGKYPQSPPASQLAGQMPPGKTQTPNQNPQPGNPGTPAPEGGTSSPQTSPQTSGTNPFFDVQPPAPSSASPPVPKPQWPSLRQRIARTGGDHLPRSYLIQETAYVGFYKNKDQIIAGFKVPERTQMLYLRPGESFWNGKIVSISPREVVVLFSSEPGQKPRREVLSRRPYVRTSVAAMGVDEPTPGADSKSFSTERLPSPPMPPPVPGFFPDNMNTPGTTGPSPRNKGNKAGDKSMPGRPPS